MLPAAENILHETNKNTQYTGQTNAQKLRDGP